MSDAFHSELLEEARADGAALHELGQHIAALHGRMSIAPGSDLDDLRREFDALHEEFEALHHADMEHRLDQRAHGVWRARVKHLTERVDGLAGVPTTETSTNASAGESGSTT